MPLQKWPAVEQLPRCFCRELTLGKGTGTGLCRFSSLRQGLLHPHTRSWHCSGALQALCDWRGAKTFLQ